MQVSIILMDFAREQRNYGDVLSRLTPIQASVLRGLADPNHPKLFPGEFMVANGVKNLDRDLRILLPLEAFFANWAQK